MRNQVRTGQLANGFRYYSQYDYSHGTHLAGIGTKVGAIHASDGCVGLPHLVEHMLARQSMKYSSREVDLICQKYLGQADEDINIRIDRVSTFYGFGDLRTNKAMVDCFDVMAHFLRDRMLTMEGLEVERAAVLNEYYLRGVDDMPALIDDSIHEIMYSDNPARMRIDCIPADLAGISISKVRSFVKKHYVPRNMFMIMLGPKFEEVKQFAESYFGDNQWEDKSVPRMNHNNFKTLPVLKGIVSSEIVRPHIGQYHFALGFPTESYISSDAETLEMIARILTFRLAFRLRESNRKFDEGVYRANVYTSRSFVHGLIYATFATVGRDFAQYGEQAILEECDKLKNELVDDRELDAMSHYVDSAYLEAFNKNPTALSEMIIEAVCNGDEDMTHLHGFRNRLHAVSRKKIRNVANKYFTKDYARVLIKPA